MRGVVAKGRGRERQRERERENKRSGDKLWELLHLPANAESFKVLVYVV